MKELTKESAESATMLIHKTDNNADGTPVRARVNGKLKTWKTRPNDWILPVKYGLRDCFYVGVSDTHRVDQNPSDWAIAENGEEYEPR